MAEYTVVRSALVPADASTVHAFLDDFHQWRLWSPWEDLDPDLQRTYTGPDRGVGARYAWKGNRKAGEGSMEITASEPDHVDVRLTFLKPFAATNDVRFTLTPVDAGTTVEWRMHGEQRGLWGLVGRLMNMDKVVGRDFEKGLARLQAAVQP